MIPVLFMHDVKKDDAKALGIEAIDRFADLVQVHPDFGFCGLLSEAAIREICKEAKPSTKTGKEITANIRKALFGNLDYQLTGFVSGAAIREILKFESLKVKAGQYV